MANLLNYKLEIFPTKPQRDQLYRILRESKYQWNRAVTIRKKLKAALVSGQFEHVVNACLSAKKNDNQARRRGAIEEFSAQNPAIPRGAVARCYDTKDLIGEVLGDLSPDTVLDEKKLSERLKEKHADEVKSRKEAVSNGNDKKKLPKLTVFWQMIRAINKYAGYAAKTYMDESFEPSMTLSEVRFNISGSAKSHRWNRAVNPSKDQRAYGAKGEPRYKRRSDGVSYQISDKTKTEDIFRETRRGNRQICINPLREGNRWMNVAYHRPIPDGGKIKQLTVNERTGHFFAVLSCEVPDSAWAIVPKQAGWRAGIDPGAKTALTVGLHNSKTGEVRQAAIDYRFLENSLDKLERLQQGLSRKQGPRRKRTEAEVNEAVSSFSSKSKIKKLPEEEKNKAIDKEKKRLEKRMIRQDASNSWKKASHSVGELNYRIANKRLDVLHKVSRSLAEGCDVVGIGKWEPERQVSFRKRKRELQRQVKANTVGAREALKALDEEKSKQGPKGVKKIRRGGRDRAIATLRGLIEEKAQRAGTVVYSKLNEAGSTVTCSCCGAKTGPTGKENLSVREWRCKECDCVHQRDLNGAFNILVKTEEEYAAAQAAPQSIEGNVARMKIHGTMVQADGVIADGFHVRGSFRRGDYSFKGALPEFWKGDEATKAFGSLIAMGVAKSLESVKNGQESPA